MRSRIWVYGVVAAMLLVAPGVVSGAGPSWMPGFPLKAGPNVMIMWAPVPGAASYKVYKSTDPAAQGAMIGEVPTNNYMDVNVPADKTFYYVIRAVVGGKEGEPSVAGVVKGVEPLATPAFEGVLQADNALHIRWGMVPKAVFYNVYRAEKPDGPFALVGSTQDVKYVDRNVKFGGSYYFQVSAVDSTSVE